MSNQALANIEQPEVKEKFVKLFQVANSIKSQQEAANFFEVEVFHFGKIIQETPAFQECSELSVRSTFLEVISNGLSFEKAQRQVYLMPSTVNIGTKDNPVYEKRMGYEIAKNGLVHITTKAGSIKSCSDPVIVYEDDHFEIKTVNNVAKIEHTPKIPRKNHTIIGGYCFITLPDNSIEPFWYDVNNVERLKKYSAKKNSRFNPNTKKYEDGQANALYTSGNNGQIDEGFFQTKIIKAALKNKPKKFSGTLHAIDDDVKEYPSSESEYLGINKSSEHIDYETAEVITEYKPKTKQANVNQEVPLF